MLAEPRVADRGVLDRAEAKRCAMPVLVLHAPVFPGELRNHAIANDFFPHDSPVTVGGKYECAPGNVSGIEWIAACRPNPQTLQTGLHLQVEPRVYVHPELSKGFGSPGFICRHRMRCEKTSSAIS
jgi:hypothetical protein